MLKKFLYLVIYYSGLNYVYSLFLKKKIFLIMYHSIGSDDSQKRLKQNIYEHISIDVKDFEKQILYLKKRGHSFVSFADLSKLDLEKINKPTVIYFDDGFKDVLENAVPILERHGIPATLFLVTGILDRASMLWTVLYREILTKEGVTEQEQTAIIHKIKMGTESDRLRIMKQFSIADYSHLFDIFMSWDDLMRLKHSNFEIGSHGHTHLRLIECHGKELDTEIVYSKNRIEEKLGHKINTFSLPYGRGDSRLVKALKTAGYSYVVSKGKGLNSKEDLSNTISYLKNISPKPNESMMMFKLRLYALNILS